LDAKAKTFPVMETRGWTKYIVFFALIGAIMAVISINPLKAAIIDRLQVIDLQVIDKSTPLERLAREYRKGCPKHQYSVKRLARVPDMMLIEGFLTKAEADVLVQLAYGPCDSQLT